MTSPDYVHNICLLGQGSECCRYLVVDVRGYHCAKLDDGLRVTIDKRSAAGRWHAKGDNCAGWPIEEILTEGREFKEKKEA